MKKKKGIQSFSIFSIDVRVASFESLTTEILLEIYQLRKMIFIDRRGWSIDSYTGGDFEIDSYDDADSYYLFSWNEAVTGCVRLRPSVSPTLLTGPFKAMKEQAQGRCDPGETWEASRFFITPKRIETSSNIEFKLRGDMDARTLALFLGMFEFGRAMKIKAFEVVVDSVMLRILKRCGWELEIFNFSYGFQGEKLYYGILSCDAESYKSIRNKFFFSE
ncbi:MAG: hypothetical protein GYB15_01480 [Gammaproteobacteria bacterium]|nr:hypothetical protein [Gammaproteobacteria bacterium]